MVGCSRVGKVGANEQTDEISEGDWLLPNNSSKLEGE